MKYCVKYPSPINAVIGDCIAFVKGVHESDLTHVLPSFAASPEAAVERLKGMGCTIEIVEEEKPARKSRKPATVEPTDDPNEGGE